MYKHSKITKQQHKKKTILRLKQFDVKNMQCYSRCCITGQNAQCKIAMNLAKLHITFAFQAIIFIKTI